MPTKKKSADSVYVFVEYYRATEEQRRDLQRFLRESEGIESVSTIKGCPKGGVEVGYFFGVYVLPVLVSYAGNKILTLVEDRVKEWFKERGKKDQFITLQLTKPGTRRRKVGKGTPRRGDQY